MATERGNTGRSKALHPESGLISKDNSCLDQVGRLRYSHSTEAPIVKPNQTLTRERCAIIPNVKIAVVDDDQDTRNFIATVLMYCVNREVLAFESGEALWKHLVSSDSFDIVLSDVEMPEMDGLELLAKIKSAFPEITCIVMSGKNENEARALELGADAFLAKPFKVNDLFSLVEAFVIEATPGDMTVN